MRLGDDGSDNFIDRTGRGGMGFGGGGGNMLGCLLPLVASRFGMVGVLVLLLGYCALQSLRRRRRPDPGRRLRRPRRRHRASRHSTPEERRVLSGVLLSTEQVWGADVPAVGRKPIARRR